MNLKRLLHTKLGVTMISILLGFGLATLFRKVCSDKSCIKFNGPIIGDVVGKVYQHGDKCFKYDIAPIACDRTKQSLNMTSPDEIDITSYESTTGLLSQKEVKTSFLGF
jgi:hypothetical protein